MGSIEFYALVGFFSLVWLSSKAGYEIQKSQVDLKNQDSMDPKELAMGNSLGAWIGGGLVTLLSVYIFLV